MLKHRRGQPRSLSHQVVAITGGARGIDHETARALAQHGARVAIGDLDGDLPASVAADLGRDAFAVGVDVFAVAGEPKRLEEVPGGTHLPASARTGSGARA